MEYFEDQIQNGNWDEVERYLFGFTKLEESELSSAMFRSIRIHKYLEALDM